MSGAIDPDKIRANLVRFVYSPPPENAARDTSGVNLVAQQAFKSYVQEMITGDLEPLEAVVNLKTDGDEHSDAYKGMEAFLDSSKNVQKYVYSKMRACFTKRAHQES